MNKIKPTMLMVQLNNPLSVLPGHTIKKTDAAQTPVGVIFKGGGLTGKESQENLALDITAAYNNTYAAGIDPVAVKAMYDLLVSLVDKEEKAYKGRKESADHFNNNTDGVGIKFDYEIPADMPKWVATAKSVIEKAKL